MLEISMQKQKHLGVELENKKTKFHICFELFFY